MAVDASRLKRRRTLGAPPTEGAAGIEEESALDPTQTVLAEPDGIEGKTSAKLKPPDTGPEASPASLHPEVEPEALSREREDTAPAQRRRVPPLNAEPRVPFTTRIAVSTKERLEDACYHLRMKHQAFIDEAIKIHLEKHGF